MSFFIQLLATDPLAYLVAFAAAAFGLVVHNLFQAWLADRYKDGEPRRYGFLTVEPRVHLEAMGVLFLALLGFGIPRFVPTRLYGTKAAQVALMGPLGLFVAALVCAILFSLLQKAGASTQSIAMGFAYAAQLLINMAAVYLFPVPPLDGARVVYAIGSPETRRFMDQLQAYGPIGFLVIFMVLNFTGILPAVSGALFSLISRILTAIGL